MQDLPLFRLSHAVRRSDPITSVMAAESVAPHVTEYQLRALAIFYAHPVSSFDDFQLAEATGLKQTSVGKRRLELAQKGYVEKTFRRESPSRLTNAVVQAYRITQSGVEFFERYLAEQEGNKK